jgi:Mn-dependent DtxR family transcriptional regulator
VKIIKDACNAVTESNLKGVWKKLCPESVQDFEGFENPVENVTETVIEIANRLDLEVSPEDVTEVLQSHSQDLGNEDLIETEEQGIIEDDEDEQEVAKETIHIKSAIEIFETNDLNFERSSKVLEAMKTAYACYREIYHEEKKASSVQTSLDSYFKKPQPMQKSPQKATVATEPHKSQSSPPI